MNINVITKSKRLIAIRSGIMSIRIIITSGTIADSSQVHQRIQDIKAESLLVDC